MAIISLPVQGEKDWGNKLNTAISTINSEVASIDLTVDNLQTLVTNGRLSVANLNRYVVDDGEGHVPDAALPTRLTPEGISAAIRAQAIPDRGDSFMAALDQRRNASIMILGDSTGIPFYGDWTRHLGELLGSDYPNVKVQSRWFNLGPQWPTPTVVSSGETAATVARDSFNRTSADLVGSASELGATWTSGTPGKYTASDGAARFVNGSTALQMQRLPLARPGRVDAYADWSLIYDGTHFGAYYFVSGFVSASTFLWIEMNFSGTPSIIFKKSLATGGTTVLGTKTIAEAGILARAEPNLLRTSIKHVGDQVTFTAGNATATYTLTSAESAIFAGGSEIGFWGLTNDHSVLEIGATGVAPAASTLDVYNASVAGSRATEPLSKIPTLMPFRPDAVVLSYSHNHSTQTPAEFESQLDELVTAIRAVHSGMPIIISGQNPQYSPTANPVQHNARQADLRRYARTKGFGYIPVFEAFMAQPNPRALVIADGVHETEDGARLWAQSAVAYLREISAEGLPAAIEAQLAVAGAIKGESGKQYGILAGAIRNDGAATGYWKPIEDTDHHTVGLDSIRTTGASIQMDYASAGFKKMISFVVGCDETLARFGFSAGASVTKDQAIIYFAHNAPVVGEYVYYNGTNWVPNNANVQTAFNTTTGALTITHAPIPAETVFRAAVTPRGGGVLDAQLSNDSSFLTSTTMKIEWRDAANAVVKTPSMDMRAVVTHGGGLINTPSPQVIDTVAYPNSNLWYIGVFEL